MIDSLRKATEYPLQNQQWINMILKEIPRIPLTLEVLGSYPYIKELISATPVA